MKICFLTHNVDSKNGGGRFSLEFIQHLQASELAPEIVLLTTAASGYQGEQPILCPNKIKLFLSLPKLRKIFKQCDIAHAFDGWPYGVVAALAHFGLKNKLIITAVGTGSLQPLHNWRAPVLRWAYRQANTLVAISSYTAREIKQQVSKVDIKIVPLGINFEYFASMEYKYLSSVLKLDLTKNYQLYILSVGRLKPRKGYDVSLRVFARLAADYPDLRYVIIGSGLGGDYHRRLQQLAVELRIADEVIFKENVSDDELAAWYRQAELFLLLPQNVNYDVEGFGLVFLEAAAFGLPVIGASNSGAEDAIWDGQNGFLVKPDDVSAVTARAEEILDNRTLRQKFSANSLIFAKKMSWEHTISEYVELYKTLL